MEVNIHDAKTQLSRLIQRALAGEDVTIAKAGTPLVRLIPIGVNQPVLGSARGTITMAEGWDDPMTGAEIEKLFGGGVFPGPKAKGRRKR